MRPFLPLFGVLLLSFLDSAVQLAHATDTDGPDCGRAIQDFGDAPEGVPFDGTIGGTIARYPTCLAPSPPGTQEFVRNPRSSPPGMTGYVRHVQSGSGNYWLGCHPGPSGIDSEPDGKVSENDGATSLCQSGLAVDCATDRSGFGQDECVTFGSESDLGTAPEFASPCPYGPGLNYMYFSVYNCGPQRVVYMNVLIDFTFDGDWNDNVACVQAPDSVAHEWVFKNRQIVLPNGCSTHSFQDFFLGFEEGNPWMRVSLTDQPVGDEYPWAGSALSAGGSFEGGETEDLLYSVFGPLNAKRATWGSLKIRYR